MLPYSVGISQLRRPSSEDARERTLQAVAQFNKATEKLERRCKEIGMKVPILVC